MHRVKTYLLSLCQHLEGPEEGPEGVAGVCHLSTSQDLLEQVVDNQEQLTHLVPSLLHTFNETATTTASTTAATTATTTAITDREGAKARTGFKGQNRYDIFKKVGYQCTAFFLVILSNILLALSSKKINCWVFDWPFLNDKLC